MPLRLMPSATTPMPWDAPPAGQSGVSLLESAGGIGVAAGEDEAAHAVGGGVGEGACPRTGGATWNGRGTDSFNTDSH